MYLKGNFLRAYFVKGGGEINKQGVKKQEALSKLPFLNVL
jgi:hypothetical protein